jgi:hypothetical protein
MLRTSSWKALVHMRIFDLDLIGTARLRADQVIARLWSLK